MRRMDRDREREMVAAYQSSELSSHRLAEHFGVGASTLYRALRRNGIDTDPAKRSVARRVRRFLLSEDQQRAAAAAYADGARPKALALMYGCSVWTIREAVRRHAQVRSRGNQFRVWAADDIANIVQRYNAGESQAAIASSLGTTQSMISRLLRADGVDTPRLSGSRHGSWKGGRSMHGDGYVYVLVGSDNPFASMRNGSGYVLEHRLVMAQHLGRPLTSTESVHHIDGDRSNNSIENLQLRRGKHGRGVVLVCADCGSHNVIEQPIGADP